MKKFIFNNWFKVTVAVCLLFIGFSIFYYLVFFIPQKERDNLNFKKQQEEKNSNLVEQARQRDIQQQRLEAEQKSIQKYLLDQCIAAAKKKAKDDFDAVMNASVGTNVSPENLQKVSDDISEWVEKEEENCFKKYLQN